MSTTINYIKLYNQNEFKEITTLKNFIKKNKLLLDNELINEIYWWDFDVFKYDLKVLQNKKNKKYYVEYEYANEVYDWSIFNYYLKVFKLDYLLKPKITKNLYIKNKLSFKNIKKRWLYFVNDTIMWCRDITWVIWQWFNNKAKLDKNYLDKNKDLKQLIKKKWIKKTIRVLNKNDEYAEILDWLICTECSCLNNNFREIKYKENKNLKNINIVFKCQHCWEINLREINFF